MVVHGHNKPINSDSKKPRSFVTPLFAAGYGRRHVYWIQSALPNSQSVYFVVDSEGEKTVYLLAGNVTQEFYEAVLSNLRVTKVP